MESLRFLTWLLVSLSSLLATNARGYNGDLESAETHNVIDYYSYPKYAFGYEVEDYYNKLSHGRWEVRDGDVVQGQYRVLLPDGRIQIVSYVADKHGYRPKVQYVGKGAHPPPPPAYAHVKPPKFLEHQYLGIGTQAAPAVVKQPVVVQHRPIRIKVRPYVESPQENFYSFDPSYGSYGGSRIAKKRALLYDRTLFRRDIPSPSTTPRK